MGGVWEWTSSVLQKHEGFEPMPLYPNYTGKGPSLRPHEPLASGFCFSIGLSLDIHVIRSLLIYRVSLADFFDGKHNIVLGGSWATIPRIAGRKSL